ncbi:hypothetical protein [Microvirga tunisiensis]|uniref:Uncharacterized protein n=1 Tax=Microvirga tunisiensis TaxID=2108360 RepID=A0A5N7MAC2_9HYPH|nr:hypothetical protein [Microvirga tunisiensis]MPR05663.1 hypothetical protein [Microvirga tunisiensis]MPR23863.1 hypothetical protein [Microvirga tunisiensis]
MRTITLNLSEWTVVRVALENLAAAIGSRLEAIQQSVDHTTEIDLPLLAAYTSIHDKAESYGELLFTLIGSSKDEDLLTLPFDFMRTLPVAILHLSNTIANGSSIVETMSLEAKAFLLENAGQLQRRISREAVITDRVKPEVVRELFRWEPTKKKSSVH